MARIQWTGISGIGMIVTMLVVACTLDDDGGGSVFACDASATVAEYCLEEPASPTTQEISKATCLSAKGTWSSRGCPSGYTKRCKEGDKVNYYYNKSDGNKACSDLIGAMPYSGGQLALSREALSLEPAILVP